MKTPTLKHHVICPLCGHFHFVRPSEALPVAMSVHHELLGKVQKLGGKSDISWTERPLTDEELLALQENLTAVCDRINDEISKRGI